MAHNITTPPPFTLDLKSGLSLALAFGLLPTAQFLASTSLPKTNTPRKLYWLFIWFAYDVLMHSSLEASFLYHSFFSYVEVSNSAVPITSDYPHPASLGSNTGNTMPVLYGDHSRRYGAFYSDAPMARLWQEYAKADRRWGEADLTVVALEVLTVFGAGPAAAYACYLISKITWLDFNINNNTNKQHATRAKTAGSTDAAMSKAATEAMFWFVAIAVSTGELYGGFMTFAPEWLSGNPSLAGDDPVYLWLYLVFFNTVWVWIPLWVMYEGFKEMKNAFLRGANLSSSSAISAAKAGKKA